MQIEKLYYGAKAEILINSNKIDVSEIKNFRIKAFDFYIELVFQIKKRFKFDDPSLTFISNFDPKKAASGEVTSIASIINYFPQLVDDIEALNTEWRLLPDIKNVGSVEEYCSFIFSLKNGTQEYMFPNLTKLIKGLMCLPHSSAAAERLFSQLNLIKTKVRNRLEIETCECILHSKHLLKNNNCFNLIGNQVPNY